MPGQAVGGAGNPYARAQSALATGKSTLKISMYAMIGIGGLCMVGGLVWLITGSIGGGLGMLVAGAVTIGSAFTLPKFMGQMNQATSMVDGLAAKAQLAQTGLPAHASVVSMQQTGRMVNFNPEAALVLDVTHPHTQARYQVQTTAVVPQMNIPQVQPGMQIHVRINPQNPMDVALPF